MKKTAILSSSFLLFYFGCSINLSAEEKPQSFNSNFAKQRNPHIFTCKKEPCTFSHQTTGLINIPLLKGWAIEEPFFEDGYADTPAEIPTISFIDTKSRLWIDLNNYQMADQPGFAKCHTFKYEDDLRTHSEKICISQDSKSPKSLLEADKMAQLIKQWRVNSGNLKKEQAQKAAQKLAKQGLKKYDGNFFSVLYPISFTAIPAMNHEISGYFARTDEATFKSPDGKVEFFVYSPLWSGRPKDYLKPAPNEVLASEDAKKGFKKNKYRNYTLTRWATFKAKDGAYLRSYVAQRACHDDGESSSFNDCVFKTFGFKYTDQKAYKQYKPAYLKFKKSLEQSAD